MTQIIVFEGIDSSGKSTQSRLLADYFSRYNIPNKRVHFPKYQESFFGKIIEKMLKGAMGELEDLNPHLISLLFASERFENKQELISNQNKEGFLILDRYVMSNMAHQSAKLKIEKRLELFDWIYQMEHSIFKIPKPNVTFFLDVPPKKSNELMQKRNEKKDLYEQDFSYIHQVYEAFNAIIAKGYYATTEINCYNNQIMKSQLEIHQQVLDHLQLETKPSKNV